MNFGEVYLDYLENESITKYPNLKYDKEFNKYIIKIRNKLNSNYNKLQQKQKMINKYIKQNIQSLIDTYRIEPTLNILEPYFPLISEEISISSSVTFNKTG